MKGWVRKLPKYLFGNYYIFRIYSYELDHIPPERDPDCLIFSNPHRREDETTGYAGPDAIGFAYEQEGVRLSHCWVWYGERYKSRNFWPLAANEAKLIALETLPEARGRGIATRLLQYVVAELAARDFKCLYARIWHSNKPSIRAFEKAGWRYHALVLEFHLLGKRRRIVRRK